MPNNLQLVVPMLSYEDGLAALDWLCAVFGFKEKTRMAGPDGRLAHGEVLAGDGLIMLASPTPEYQSPRHHRESCQQARRWLSVPWIIDGVLVYVDDLDSHFERARQAGATSFQRLKLPSWPTLPSRGSRGTPMVLFRARQLISARVAATGGSTPFGTTGRPRFQTRARPKAAEERIGR
jgi:uncharacterized glyoxalase superfamily protein PhnB